MRYALAVLLTALIGVGCWLAWELHRLNAFCEKVWSRFGWD